MSVATLDSILQAERNERREREKVLKQQWATLVRDFCEGTVTQSDEDVLAELRQLGKTGEDLLAAKALYDARKVHLVNVSKLIEADSKVGGLMQERERLSAKLNADIQALRAKFNTDAEKLDTAILQFQSCQNTGANSRVWLMEHRSDELNEALRVVEREQSQLMQEKQRLTENRQAAMDSMNWTEKRRAEIQGREAQIEARLKVLSDQSSRIQLDSWSAELA